MKNHAGNIFRRNELHLKKTILRFKMKNLRACVIRPDDYRINIIMKFLRKNIFQNWNSTSPTIPAPTSVNIITTRYNRICLIMLRKICLLLGIRARCEACHQFYRTESFYDKHSSTSTFRKTAVA